MIFLAKSNCVTESSEVGEDKKALISACVSFDRYCQELIFGGETGLSITGAFCMVSPGTTHLRNLLVKIIPLETDWNSLSEYSASSSNSAITWLQYPLFRAGQEQLPSITLLLITKFHINWTFLLLHTGFT